MNNEVLWLKNLLNENLWIAEVFVIVFFVLLFNAVQKYFSHRLYIKLKQTDKVWDDALVRAIGKPLTLCIWIVGIAFAAQIVQQKTSAIIFEAVDPIRDVGVIGCITWFLLRLVRRVEDNFLEKEAAKGQEIDRTTVDAIAKLVKVSFVITSVLVVLQTLGYSISGVLAFGGIGGVAVGFAAKDLLANFFGGLIIYLDRPFAVGDWVRSPDREIEGTVEKIGWRLTVIRTFDKRPLYIPNATFSSIAVENPSRMTNRRIYETIGIRYDDFGKIDGIIEDVRSMLTSHPDIDTSRTLMVNFNAYAASSLDFFIYTFTKTIEWTEYHNIKQDILLRVGEIITNHGAEIAFPTSTVHLAGIGSDQAKIPVTGLAGKQ
ncbi:MAG: mechanosensitive ion channel family protein [Gammaproteobacteria bacterium]|nr:mechanosensitive ion channel family protein [Gammaproteobacteria bacterium]